MIDNAADRKAIRVKEKAARLAERERGDVIRNLMSTTHGRRYLWDKLGEAHVFATSFSSDPLAMAFNEGERNFGLRLLNEITRWCPEQFIQAMRESNERHISDDSSASSEHSRGEDDGRDDLGSDEAGREPDYRHPSEARV